MGELRILDLAVVISAAESALSSACGRPVKVQDTQVLSDEDRRNLIVRAEADYGNGRVKSLILKATRSPNYDPNAENVLETSGLIKEWVATAYLAARAPSFRHGSLLLAGVVPHGILIFEDLGSDLGSLVYPLLKGNADDAERALTSYALALAHLHASTVGCIEAHYETFESIFGTRRPRRLPESRVEKQADYVIQRLGGAPPAAELAQISHRLSDPGAWLALIHGDTCPDNALFVADQVRLIDYEFAKPSHALLDAIYWRIGFPTCWCAGRIPREIASRVEAVYRAEIGKTMPLARDDNAYCVELAFAAAIWLFRCLAGRLDKALEEDTKWGIASVRSRLLWYLEASAELFGAAEVLPGIRHTAEAWLAELQNRWSDTQTLGFYPAFVSDGK
jgi:Phosphotransferase enzyme family